jgi:hypothetical protein
MEPQTWTDFFTSMIPAFFIFILWLIAVLIAFACLRNQALDDTARVLWVLIILVLPVVGPLTYLMLFSQTSNSVAK